MKQDKVLGWALTTKQGKNDKTPKWYAVRSIKGKTRFIYVGKDSSRAKEKIQDWCIKNHCPSKADLPPLLIAGEKEKDCIPLKKTFKEIDLYGPEGRRGKSVEKLERKIDFLEKQLKEEIGRSFAMEKRLREVLENQRFQIDSLEKKFSEFYENTEKILEIHGKIIDDLSEEKAKEILEKSIENDLGEVLEKHERGKKDLEKILEKKRDPSDLVDEKSKAVEKSSPPLGFPGASGTWDEYSAGDTVVKDGKRCPSSDQVGGDPLHGFHLRSKKKSCRGKKYQVWVAERQIKKVRHEVHIGPDNGRSREEIAVLAAEKILAYLEKRGLVLEEKK